MQDIDSLVEQHIRESDSHLRRIDELMTKAQQASKDDLRSQKLQPLLSEIAATRARLARSVDDLRVGFASGGSPELVQRGNDLQSDLRRAGSEFEKAVTTIFDTRGV
jgi:hypothetical protein